MVFKLHGFPSSPCTLRVATVLHEKKLPFEFVPVSLFTGEHKSPEYLKIQPFGQIPYLEDDDFVVFESRAICKYIEAKHPSLAPAKDDLRAYGHYEQALSVEVANFDHFATIALAEKMFGPMKGFETNEAALAGALKSLDGKLDAYNVILGKQKYLAGDKLTLADLFHLPEGTLLEQIDYKGLSDLSRPNVARWWKELTSRESWIGLKEGVKSVSA